MSTPKGIKGVTHRPVILTAPDWPEMVALKELAASLGADVEGSPLVTSRHVRIAWVPIDFAGSATAQLARQRGDVIAGSIAAVVRASVPLAGALDKLGDTMREFLDAARPGNDPGGLFHIPA